MKAGIFSNPDSRFALRISAAYAAFGAAWIFFSDRALELLVDDRATLLAISRYKGWFFIVLTALLLYLLTSRLKPHDAIDRDNNASFAVKRPRGLALMLGLSITLVIAVVVGNLFYTLWYDRSDRLREATVTTGNLVRVIEEHSNGLMKAIDATLTSAVVSVRQQPTTTASKTGNAGVIMKSNMASLPYVRALFVVDSDGLMIHDSEASAAQPVNFGDREYFVAHRDSPGKGLYIARPVVSRTTGRWMLTVSKRIEDRQGKFAGVAVAAIELDKLVAFYDSIRVGSKGSITLFRRDGILLARSPFIEAMEGQDISAAPLFKVELPRASNGNFLGEALVDGIKRKYAYRTVGEWPLVVAAGLSEDEVLAGWRSMARLYAAVSLAFIAIVLFMAWHFWRELNRREKLTQSLAESEQRFRGLTELSSDWYWEQDADLRFTKLSENFFKQSGVVEMDVLRRRSNELQIVHGFSDDLEKLEQATEARESFRHMVFRVKGTDGSVRWWETSGQPLFDGEKKFLGYRGVGRDMTGLVEVKQALKDSEHRYQYLFEVNPHAMWIYDAETLRFVEVNDAALKYYGYTRDEFLSMGLADIRPEEDIPRMLQMVGEDLELPHVNRGEWRHRKKDGSIIDVEVISTAIDFVGRKSRLVMAQDISQRRAAEEKVQRLNAELETRVKDRTAELEATNRELEAFSYSISHDLRAPVRHIEGFAAGLRLGEDPLTETQSKFLGRIETAARRMFELINDLLEFSLASRSEMVVRSVPLGDLIPDIRDECMRDAEGRSIEWRIGPLPKVMADDRLLKPALFNLLSNAVKFTRDKPRALIEVGTKGGYGDNVTIFVRDNGAGFDMQFSSKLFGVFQRLHAEREFPGTGIGLAIVRRIVERHGGQIWAEAALGKGATFFVTLKRASAINGERELVSEVAT